MIRKIVFAAMLALAPAAQAQTGIDQRVIGEFTPTRDMTSAALGATAAFWAALDRGDLSLSYGLTAPALRDAVTLQEFTDAVAPTADFGVPRRVMRLTWHHEQPNYPGTALAVDWQVRDGDTLLGGGYLIWQLLDDGTFGLLRLDTTDLRDAQ
ncbi:hypothetical protein SAMN06273572_10293 [Monaibacterium marinum]|uniref:Uncharacterized protein n=1 Tax=Pontivivens marinum TaxID=1690039 RepID=A0A2C9CQD2_9RHOB|nr:hypothetical protein [Monaibacterium marinum]SOH93417.1 hypothetical protein SAMN06273572_10293 [Monaibacterium marinum]